MVIAKLKNYLMNNREIGYFIFIFILIILYYQNIFGTVFFDDSCKLLSADKGPFSYDWSYWWHIFTNTNHADAQYRPLSYFVYFFVMSKVFGMATAPYYVVGIGLFILTAFFFFWFLKTFFCNENIAFIGTLVFVLHPIQYHIILFASMHVKYYLPLLSLFISLRIVFKRSPLSITETVFVAALVGISLLAHEGSVFFSAIIVSGAMLNGRKDFFKYLVILAPTFVYSALRVFVFKIPSKGMFDISFSSVHYSLSYYYEIVFNIWRDNPLGYHHHLYPVGTFFLCTIIVGSIYSMNRWRDYKLTFICIIASGVILPFAVLANHIIFNRSIWGVIVGAMIMALIVKVLWGKGRGSRVMGIMLMTLWVIIAFEKRYYYFEYPNEKEVPIFLDEIRRKVEGIPINKLIRFEFERQTDFASYGLIPGILATNFPERKFIYNYHLSSFSNFADKVLAVRILYIEKSFIYYKVDGMESTWRDVFRYKYHFPMPLADVTLSIPGRFFTE